MQHTIRFVLDGRIVEVDFRKSSGLKPTTTLLNWLRTLPGHKGVKEGCGQGDCGACTVVVATPSGKGKLVYKTIDSCLVFLPMVHGKQVITVENLSVPGKNNKTLHPVQQALVDVHGIQCGYCTPGMVMSLFGLYKNHPQPSRKIIGDALTGNLCRCTGYRSVIRAAQQACMNPEPDHFSDREKEVCTLLEGIRANQETIEIGMGNQTYFRPFTLTEALRLRRDNPDALIISGSTDVAIRQTKHKEVLSRIIDLSGVEELQAIREDKGQLIIGAGASVEEIRQFSGKRFPVLVRLLNVFGSLQIRNMATMGGNIASASPVGDTLPFLVASGAKVILSGGASERTIPVEDFITGYRVTGLRKDELIREIMIPIPATGTRIGFYKISKRKDLDISTVSGAFRINMVLGAVTDIILAFGGMAVTVVRGRRAEQYLKGKKWTRETVKEAIQVLAGEFDPISDARASAEYRHTVAGNLLLKFYLETTSPAGEEEPGRIGDI